MFHCLILKATVKKMTLLAMQKKEEEGDRWAREKRQLNTKKSVALCYQPLMED